MKTPIEPVYIMFGARLGIVREALGLTQDDLGKKSGLSRTSICNIEAGKQRVLLGDVKRFADALGVPPKSLLRGLYL